MLYCNIRQSLPLVYKQAQKLLYQQTCTCPYCGESFDTTVDLSGGTQSYVEDCYVCCRPIEFVIEVDTTGELTHIQFTRDDE